MTKENKLEKFEKIFHQSSEILANLETILDELEKNQENYKELFEYYYQGEWLSDLEKIEKEDRTHIMNYRILSEDSIYDLTCNNRDLAIRMLEIATKIIKHY